MGSAVVRGEVLPVEPFREAVAQIVGMRLVSVGFLLDHLALDFDGYNLGLNVYPRVMDEGADCGFGDVGYRNKLLSLIEHTVESAVLDAERLQIGFGNGIELSIRLDEKRTSDETLILSGAKGYRIAL